MGRSKLARFFSIFRKGPASRKRPGRDESNQTPYLFKIKVDAKTLYIVRNRES